MGLPDMAMAVDVGPAVDAALIQFDSGPPQNPTSTDAGWLCLPVEAAKEMPPLTVLMMVLFLAATRRRSRSESLAQKSIHSPDRLSHPPGLISQLTSLCFSRHLSVANLRGKS